MAFLIPIDYTVFIRQEILDDLINNSKTSLARAELLAQSQMETFLRTRYDVSTIFSISIKEYNAAKQYSEGDLVYYSPAGGVTAVYRYINEAASIGNDPTDEAHWELGDSRHQDIVEKMVHLVLYKLHQPLAPSQIPQFVADNYADVLDWLKMIRDRKIDPALPKLETGEERNQMTWMSNPKRVHHF